MKKFFLMLLAMLLAATSLSVFAEDEALIPSPGAAQVDDEPILLEGFVMELLEGAFLFQAMSGEEYEVILSDDTIIEGKEIAVGDCITITYDGTATFSLPAQIVAQYVGNHMLMGLVSEMTETGFTLTFGEEVYAVNADPAQMATIQDGMFVTVYHNGMMTRSIPPQVSALHIRGEEIVGVVTEMVEGGFTLTVEGEELPYHIAIREDALQFVQPEPGMEIIVIADGVQTASLESILVNATEILPLPVIQEVFDMAGIVTEIGEGFILIQTADGQTVQVNTFEETMLEGKEIEVGDYIHVTYNGQMTFSIPAQIAARKIGCYAHTGVVGQVTDGQFELHTDAEVILVNAPAELMENIAADMTVTVYSNGAMTMSLPAQIGAEMITATGIIAD